MRVGAGPDRLLRALDETVQRRRGRALIYSQQSPLTRISLAPWRLREPAHGDD
jgi:hypothetical protein